MVSRHLLLMGESDANLGHYGTGTFQAIIFIAKGSMQ
jgi:hypothetical protein